MKSVRDMEFLIDEIRILKELSHPNIISLYDVYEEEDSVHLVMEYVEGGELFSRIESKGKYSEDEARKFMRQLIATVYFLHKKQILHRDFKLENILLL